VERFVDMVQVENRNWRGFPDTALHSNETKLLELMTTDEQDKAFEWEKYGI